MATDGGSRSDREGSVSLHPSSEEFLIFREMDAETRAKYSAFSEPAKMEFRQAVLGHATKLIRTTDTCRENEDGHVASAANVQEAVVLIKRREGGGGLKELWGILGGILAGHGLSTLNEVVKAGQFDKKGIILGAAFGAFGLFLIALGLPRDILPMWQRRKSAKPQKPLKVRRRPGSQVSKGRGSKA